jgi:histidine triad (HIT) family protein
VTCIFCEIVAGRAPASVIGVGERVMAFLDIHPWRPGHALIIPRRHAIRVGELAAEDRAALARATFAVLAAVRGCGMPCADANVLINDGPAANQTVGHVHAHVVPRTGGDGLRLLSRVLTHLAPPVRRPAPRAVLDGHAAQIAAAIDCSGW